MNFSVSVMFKFNIEIEENLADVLNFSIGEREHQKFFKYKLRYQNSPYTYTKVPKSNFKLE